MKKSRIRFTLYSTGTNKFRTLTFHPLCACCASSTPQDVNAATRRPEALLCGYSSAIAAVRRSWDPSCMRFSTQPMQNFGARWLPTWKKAPGLTTITQIYHGTCCLISTLVRSSMHRTRMQSRPFDKFTATLGVLSASGSVFSLESTFGIFKGGLRLEGFGNNWFLEVEASQYWYLMLMPVLQVLIHQNESRSYKLAQAKKKRTYPLGCQERD